ncbi:MAG: thiamine-phosphate kinase [Planctomycetota bacterium]|jgi:thiamine-monophosphate kinase|nr:thiamine-phosphate kinase [Planctomycetota bacterium]
MNENALLSLLRETFRTADPSVLVGSGPDDCAHLAADGRRLAVSVDALVEKVHFTPDAAPGDVARKAVLSALSDLAASGCRARWVLAALGLRPGLPPGWTREFASAFAQAAREEGTAAVGGDAVSSPGGVFVAVTAVGEPLPGGPVLRSGARPGDALVVSGTLGGSLLGGHLSPRPRFREMRHLLEFSGVRFGDGRAVSAALDISDGLALDLSRLCRESGVGAVVHESLVPVSAAAERAAERSGRPALRHALSDGEDFELLLAVDAGAFEEYARRPRPGLAALTRIGEIVRDAGCVLVRRSGELEPLAAEGFEHTW